MLIVSFNSGQNKKTRQFIEGCFTAFILRTFIEALFY